MRELKQNWYDLFNGFKVGLCLSKIGYAFLGLILSFLGYFIISSVPTQYGWAVGLVIAVLVILALLGAAVMKGKNLKMAGAVSVVLVVFVILNILFWNRGDGAYPETIVAFEVGLMLLAVWAYFGGAITRIAAVEVASDERIGLKEAGAFACKHYKGYLLTVIAPLVAAGLLLLCVAVWGLVSAIPVVSIVTALLVPLCALAGIAVAVIVVGLVAGSPLLFPALSAEGSDAFDALSRTFSYVFVKPWRYAWYLLVALAYGLVCLLVIKLFVVVSLMAVDKGASVGFGLVGQQDKWEVISHNALVASDKALEPIRNCTGMYVERAKALDFTGDADGGYLSRFVAWTIAVPTLPGDELTIQKAAKERYLAEYNDALNDYETKQMDTDVSTEEMQRKQRLLEDTKRRLDNQDYGVMTKEDLEAQKRSLEAELAGIKADPEAEKRVVRLYAILAQKLGADATELRQEDLETHNIDVSGAMSMELDVDVPKDNPWYFMPTSLILSVFLMIYYALVAGFAVSLKLSLFTITYLLMRRRLDGTDMTEVYRDEEVEEDYLEQTAETPVTEASAGDEAAAEEPTTEEETEEASDEDTSEEDDKE